MTTVERLQRRIGQRHDDGSRRPLRNRRDSADPQPAVMGRVRRGRGAVEIVSNRAAGVGRADGWLICVIAALCAFGLVMVYSASSPLGVFQFANPNYFF